MGRAVYFIYGLAGNSGIVHSLIYFNGASISPFAECFVNNKESKEDAILTKWSPFPLNVYFQVTFSLPLQSLLHHLPVECPKADRFFVRLFLLFF